VVPDDCEGLDTGFVEASEEFDRLTYVFETRVARMEEVARVDKDVVPLLNRVVYDTFEGSEEVPTALVRTVLPVADVCVSGV
jgi:hypothetical protein